MSDKSKALLGSFGRVFAAALLTAYLSLGKAPLDLRVEDLVVLLNAGIGALVLTAVNYFRSGETRFGKHSQDIGMGGDDALGEGGKIQTPPDGEPVEPPAVLTPEQETPVQTDNGPRAEEGERLSSRQGQVFSGEMR